MSGQRQPTSPNTAQESSHRGLVTVLLIGGIVLVVLVQQINALLVGWQWALAMAVMLAGLVSFGLASYFIARPYVTVSLRAAAEPMRAFLGVTDEQLLLLCLSPCFAVLAGLAAGESLQARNLPVALVAYALALATIVAGVLRPGKGRRGQLDRWDLLAACSLLAIAAVLRLLNVDRLPPTLSGDEGSVGLQAVSFIQGEADNPFTVGWFSFPSLFFPVQGVGVYLLGQTAAGIRVMSALAGSLTVAGLYWLARSTFGRLAALLAAFILATFHYHIHFSRLGVNNIWDGLFVVWTLAGIAYGWKHDRRLGFLIAGLALGLGQYFYVSMRVVPWVLLLWASLVFVFERNHFRRRLPDLILVGAIAAVVALPLHLYFAAHPDEFLAPMRRVTIFDGWLEQMAAMEGRPEPLIVAQQMARAAGGITHLPLRHWYNPGSPLLLAGSAALFILGLLWLVLRRRLLHWLIVLPIAAVVVLGGLSQDAPASQRYVLATPLIAIVVALPIAVVARWLWLAWPRYRIGVVAALLLGVGWLAWSNVHYYFFDVFDTYVLGGRNTETATAIGHYLDDLAPPPAVYFFGQPRMGYESLSTIPYLAPRVTAKDVAQPLEAPPDWLLSRATVFLFLPERDDELAFVRSSYPGGRTREVNDDEGVPLFVAYEVVAPSATGQ